MCYISIYMNKTIYSLLIYNKEIGYVLNAIHFYVASQKLIYIECNLIE